MKTALALGVVLGALALAGCYKTRFDLSPPQPEVASTEYNDHFHISVIGVLEVSRPVDLLRACNGAQPTAVEEQIGVIGGVVNAFLSYFVPILHVHNATVYCPIGTGMMGGQPAYPQGPYPQYPPGPQPAPAPPQ